MLKGKTTNSPKLEPDYFRVAEASEQLSGFWGARLFRSFGIGGLVVEGLVHIQHRGARPPFDYPSACRARSKKRDGPGTSGVRSRADQWV